MKNSRYARAVELAYESQFTLSPQQPFSLEQTLKKRTRWGADWYALTPFECWHSSTYYGALAFGSLPEIGLKIHSGGSGKLTVHVFTKSPLPELVKQHISLAIMRWLGIWEDLSPFYRLARNVSVIAQAAVEFTGMHDTRCLDLFEATVFCLALQRATAGRSFAIMETLCERLGNRLRFDGVEVIAFPKPRVISRLSEAELRRIAPLGYRARHVLFNAKTLLRMPVDGGVMESLAPSVRRSFLSRNFSGLGEYSAEILDPCGIPLDSWSIPTISEMIRLSGRSRSRQQLQEWFTKHFGVWSRTAFIYIINHAS